MRKFFMVSVSVLAFGAGVVPTASAGLLTATYDTAVRNTMTTVAGTTYPVEVVPCTYEEQIGTTYQSSSTCTIAVGDAAAISCAEETTESYDRTYHQVCGVSAGDEFVGCERYTYAFYAWDTHSRVRCGTDPVYVGEDNVNDEEGGQVGSTDYVEVDGEQVRVPSPLPPSP